MQAARRPITSRSNHLIQGIAAWLAAKNISPNQISLASIGFAAAGAMALTALPLAPGAFLCAVCVQLRLLCNVLDGLVAVEHGKKSAVGALYNEVPDRVADTLLLLALGSSAGYTGVGCLAALLALATAYVRLLGGSLGLAQDFRGPMAKQHRMAVMTLGCLMAIAEHMLWGSRISLVITLALITGGALLTCGTRLQAITKQLRANANEGASA